MQNITHYQFDKIKKWKKTTTLITSHSRMFLSGIHNESKIDSRSKHAGMTKSFFTAVLQNNITQVYRFVIVAMLVLLFAQIGEAVQFRSNANGNWGTNGTWQMSTNGGATWVAATRYPGNGVADDTVLIRDGNNVVLNVSPASAIAILTVGEGTSGQLTVGNNNTARSLNINNYLNVVSNASIIIANNNATHNFYVGGNINISGNLDLNLDANSRCNLYLNGITTQNISGSGTVNLYSLNISNGTTKSLERNIQLNGDLTINAGTLDIGAYTANRVTTGGTFAISADASLRIGGTNVLPSNYTTYTFNNASTVEFYGTAQTITSGRTYGNLTLSGSGTKTFSAGTTTVNGTLSMEGTATVTVTGTLTYGANATLQYAGSSAQTTGAEFPATFNGTGGVIINNSNGVTLNSARTIGTTSRLNLTSGILNTTTTNLLTIANTATNSIVGGFATSYVDGPLARTLLANIATDGTNYIYPVGAGGSYRPFELINIRTGATAPVVRVTNAATGALTSDEATMTNVAARNWHVELVSGNYTTAIIRLTESGLVSTNVIGKSSAQSGNYVSLGGTNIGATISNLVADSTLNAYYAIGTAAVKPLYSYQSGDWDNATSWTTDASGSTWINGRVPTLYDDVTILNGRTITINSNNKNINSLTLNAGSILDIKSTTGHTFNTVSGFGKLMLSSNTLPTATYTNFVASNRGTIEYYNLNNTSLSTTQLEYNNLIISNYTTNNYTSYFINNVNPKVYTINGNLSIKRYSTGTNTVSFGNPTASDNLIEMTIYGDLTVDAGCNIRVNNFATSVAIPNPTTTPLPPYPVHTLNIYGNLVNNGSIRFTGLPSPVINAYYLNANTGYGGVNYGHVQVFFRGASNKSVTCNGVTDFYRLIVEKGSDKTYTLEIFSSNVNNFALYAPNNLGGSVFDGGPEGFGYGAYYKALFIRYGTLKLNENINIPSLTEAGQDFNIIPTAGLWINGANVSTTVSGFNGSGYQAATLYGTLRISAGQFSTGDAAGLVLGTLGTPVIRIESNGTLDVSQLWSNAGSNISSYVQTGGTANFRGNGENHAGAMLGLNNTNSSFSMSDGVMNFTSGGQDNNILNIQAQPGNFQVTGGTVNINLPGGVTYVANSTVPFYNLNITRSSGAGATTIVWNQPSNTLNVLNNLSIGANAVLNLNTNAINLNVGGNFTIATGGTYTPSTTLTTSFNGNGIQLFDNAGTITGGFNNLTFANSTVTSILTNNVTVNGTLTIESNATLNDSGKVVTVVGNIVNSGTHRSSVAAGGITLTGTAAQTIGGNGNGVFNHLILNKTGGTVTVNANIGVNGNLRLAGVAGNWNILNIGANKLTFGANAAVYSDMGTGTTFASDRMIQTNGLLSDAGVAKRFANTNAFLYPFGFGTNYLPASLQYSAAPDTFGIATIKPVNGRHPLAQGNNNALACYWKTSSTGFVNVPAGSVRHLYYYTDTFVPVINDDANYIPAYYNNAAQWISIDNTSLVDESANIVSYNVANSADGEFTAGHLAAFGPIPTLYSVANGNWNVANTWSLTRGGTAGNGGTPTASTLVYVTNGTTVTVTANNATSSSLSIENGGTLNLQNYNAHTFGSIVNDATNGCGTLRIASNDYFPAGDWGYFLGPNGGTVEYYNIGANVIIPTFATSYKNLILNHSGANTITLPNINLTVYGDLTVSGSGTGNVTTNTTASRSYTINGNLNVNSGVLQYANAFATTIKVMGNTTIADGATLRVIATGTVVANSLEVYGNISCNGTGVLDLFNTTRYVTIDVRGTNTQTISGNGTIDLNNINVNKGTDTTSSVTLLSNVTTNANPSLTLTNGTFRLNSDATTLNITNAAANFTIPASACLDIQNGTARIAYNSGAGTGNSDLILSGKVIVSGGNLTIGNIADNTNNDIEYTAAGTPEIIVTAGQLNVNGQIRRSTAVNTGSLNYTQTGGTTTIRARNPQTSRSVLEILNINSKFDMSGGTIILANPINVVIPYDLVIEPEHSDVTGGTIQFGLAGVTPANTLFDFKSSVPLGSIVLESTTNSSVIQQVYDVEIMDNLTIGGATGYYNANSLDVTIWGNLTNNNTNSAIGLNVGGFRPQSLSQTTIFYGVEDQYITGTNTPNTTNFANLEIAVDNGYSVYLNNTTPSNIVVNLDLIISSGTLNDGGNTIRLLNDVDNNGTHVSPNSAVGGILFASNTYQIMSGNGAGIFGNIEINNNGEGVDMVDNTTINGQIKFTNGYLYIDNYHLILGQNATYSGTINENRSIVLNGVANDAGVTKVFPTGSYSFTYPITVNNKYTPCTFNFTSNSNPDGATINIVPVDALHPTINPADYTNYLKYYWKVGASGFSSAYNVTQTYTYKPSDAVGSPANIERCDNATSNWSTVTGSITSPTFNFSTTSLVDGSYTIGDVYASLPSAISQKSGNWSDPTLWSIGAVPNGHAVTIRSQDSVALDINSAKASSVILNGVLDALNTTFHNLGQVSGSGKIKLLGTASGMFVFPGGNYDLFMADTNSTVEYYGNNDATMPLTPGSVNKPYQRVIFSGTGIKYISSVDIQVNYLLTIENGCKLNNTLYNRDVYILGNWVDKNTATAGFTPGTGTVRFTGTSAQNISMANNTMTETFYNVAINNASGVTIQTGKVEISNQLNLTSGNINTNNTNTLTLTSTNTNVVVGGNSSSFVNGPLRKLISNASSFQFPVGDATSSGRKRFGLVVVNNTNTTGAQIWTARFVDKNPTTDGYDNTQLANPLKSASNNEYWNIIGPAGGKANVKLYWDKYSGMSDSISVRAQTKVALWNYPTSSKWNSVGQTVTDFGKDSGAVATTTPVDLENRIFTIGATSEITAALVSAIASGVWSNSTIWGGGRIPTAQDSVLIGNPYEITLDVNTTIVKMKIDNGATFNNGGNTLTLTGNFTLDGTWSGAGKISLTTDNDTIFGSGNTTGTALLEIAGNNKVIASTANLTLKDASILAGNTLKNNGNLTVDNLTGGDASSTFVNAPGSTLTINGALLATGIFDAGTCANTVIYNGTIAQSIKPTTYCSIIFNGSGIKTAAGNFTTNGDFTINLNSNLTINNNVTVTIKGVSTTAGQLNNNGSILISD